MSSDDSRNRRTAQAISNAFTKLQRDHYGRGPDGVRTVVGYDHIICFLENTFMPVERTLIEAGETGAVRETRLAFQRAMETCFVNTVEEITGRKVRAFLSQVSLNPDISVEVFVLENENAEPALKESPKRRNSSAASPRRSRRRASTGCGRSRALQSLPLW